MTYTELFARYSKDLNPNASEMDDLLLTTRCMILVLDFKQNGNAFRK